MILRTRFVLRGIGVAALLLATLFAVHCDESIETETMIDSSPATVWRILTATDDYPSWNPEISQLHGKLQEGDVIEFVAGSGRDAMVFHPTILAVRPLQELRWKGYVWVPGLFDGEHRFMLEAVGDKTRFVQGEVFTGIFAGMLTRGVVKETAMRMRALNDALKRRAEQMPSR